MTSTEPRPDIFDLPADDPGSEPALLAAARAGSTAAYGILYERHRSAALGWARSALPASDASLAEDVVETAFIRVWTALGNGKGPSDQLRPYLATTVRREAWRLQRRRRRQVEVLEAWAADEVLLADEVASSSLADPAATEPGAGVGAADSFDPDAHALLTQAFGGLSGRWRHVLWLTEVEGRPPPDVGELLGVSAGSAAALAYRARRGLVAAYLGAYRSIAPTDDCREISPRLGAYLAAGPDPTGFEDVVAHLEGCRSCRDASRGVDVVGEVLMAVAPFGVLTAGLWAKGVAAHTGGAVAGASAAGASVAAATHQAGAQAGAATGASAGAGGASGGLVAAVVAAVVVVGLGIGVGVARSGDQHRSAAPTTSRPVGSAGPIVDRAPTDPGPSVDGSIPSRVPPTPSTSVRDASVDAPTPDAPPAVPVSSPPRTPPRDATPAVPLTPTTTTAVPTTTTVPSTTTSTTTSTSTSTTTSTTTPTSTTTTTTTVPTVGTASGRVVVRQPGDEDVPLAGVVIEVLDANGWPVQILATGADGSWSAEGLPAGSYRVVAFVSASYRPAEGPDPWSGGPVWAATIDEITVSGHDVVTPDLRLRLR